VEIENNDVMDATKLTLNFMLTLLQNCKDAIQPTA
jgi:hypothetical protein